VDAFCQGGGGGGGGWGGGAGGGGGGGGGGEKGGGGWVFFFPPFLGFLVLFLWGLCLFFLKREICLGVWRRVVGCLGVEGFWVCVGSGGCGGGGGDGVGGVLVGGVGTPGKWSGGGQHMGGGEGGVNAAGSANPPHPPPPAPPPRVYSTYLGCSATTADSRSRPRRMGLETPYITDITTSTNFPLAGPLQSPSRSKDAFVTKL